ncbi:putative HAD superfamily protein [Helianthus annuus]|nr:putative HAD superfamily protein [Helianthus annuus]
MSSADLKSTCEVLEREYTEEYERCIENMLTNQKGTILYFEEFDYEGLKTTLEQLSEFERRANKKVIESNVLKGLNLKRAGERLILSCCWCADLIRSSFSSGGIPTMNNVHVNEFLYKNSLSTGQIIKKIETPIDKLQAFTNILKNSDESDKTNLMIYVGDSVGDLHCLLEADIGIVIASSSSLRKSATHFGVPFVPLFSALIKKQKEHVEGRAFGWKGLSGVLYTVSSWVNPHHT